VTLTGLNLKSNLKLRLLRLCLLVPIVFFTQFSFLSAQVNSAFGERYAIIIGGIGGQEEYTEKYFSQTSRLFDLLVNKMGYDPDKVSYLFEDTGFDSLNIDYQATAENVRTVFRQAGQTMTKKDQLLVFLVGHGSYDGFWSKFNLVGPDLRDIDFNLLLSQLPTKKIILINTASASGPFIEKLSSKERVIITATKNGFQHYETNYAGFFLDALSTEEADFNKDSRISLKEAFHFSKTSQDRWFEEQRRIRSEHPMLDDNGDGEGSLHLEKSKDGLWASRVFLTPVSQEIRSSFQKIKTGMSTKADSLQLQKVALEEEIETLKARKNQMGGSEYTSQLENLLVRLAKINRELKKKPAPK
ncbi:MAG: hypothetical protein ACE5IR_21690, partial [bacterium]